MSTVEYFRGETRAEPGAGIFPRFYTRAKENPVKSRDQGRVVCEEFDYVEILIAGDNKTKIDRKVTEADINRWPEHYKAFKEKQAAPEVGTPIAQWSVVSEGRRMELLALNIKTVEALAELPDPGITRLGMGGRELVKKARAFIEQAAEMAPINKLIDKNAELEERVKAQEAQIKELMDIAAKQPKAEVTDVGE